MKVNGPRNSRRFPGYDAGIDIGDEILAMQWPSASEAGELQDSNCRIQSGSVKVTFFRDDVLASLRFRFPLQDVPSYIRSSRQRIPTPLQKSIMIRGWKTKWNEK